MTVGERIKKYRKAKGYTQQQLAGKLNVSVMTIRRFEAGTREPKREMVERMAKLLDVTPVDILFDGVIRFNTNVDKPAEELTPEEFKKANQALIKGLGNLIEGIEDAQAEGYNAILHYYNILNKTGRKEAIKRTQELTEIKKYTEPEE